MTGRVQSASFCPIVRRLQFRPLTLYYAKDIRIPFLTSWSRLGTRSDILYLDFKVKGEFDGRFAGSTEKVFHGIILYQSDKFSNNPMIFVIYPSSGEPTSDDQHETEEHHAARRSAMSDVVESVYPTILAVDCKYSPTSSTVSTIPKSTSSMFAQWQVFSSNLRVLSVQSIMYRLIQLSGLRKKDIGSSFTSRVATRYVHSSPPMAKAHTFHGTPMDQPLICRLRQKLLLPPPPVLLLLPCHVHQSRIVNCNREDIGAEFAEMADRISRGKMLVAICLLQSRNYATAEFLYKSLTVLNGLCKILPKSKEAILTLAKYHPAFRFDQSTTVSEFAEDISRVSQTQFNWENEKISVQPVPSTSDLIVFPDDLQFLPLNQCTTGRVFLMKFKNSPRKLFFWVQEPKTDKDDEQCRKVNELLNNPLVSGAGRSGRGGGGQEGLDQFAMMNQLLGLGGSGGGGDEERMDLQNALAVMDHQHLMQLLNLMCTGGGSGSGFSSFGESASGAPALPRVTPTATTTAATRATTQAPQTTSTTASLVTSISTGTAAAATVTGATAAGSGSASQPAVQLTDLRIILANIHGGAPTESGEAAVDLESVQSSSNVEQPVLNPQNEEILLAHLPDEQTIQHDDLIHTIRSPQAVDMFGMTLQTGQLAPLMSQFGLPASAVETNVSSRGDIQSVAEILEKEKEGCQGPSKEENEKKDPKRSKDKESPSKKKDDDEDLDGS